MEQPEYIYEVKFIMLRDEEQCFKDQMLEEIVSATDPEHAKTKAIAANQVSRESVHITGVRLYT